MAYPPQQPYQPPAISGVPQSPAGWRPAPPPPPRTSPGRILLITVAATVAAFAVLVGVIALVNSTSGPSAANFDVAVTSCDGTSSTASVGFTVTNKGDETRDATVRIEYRDGAGARLDTDTSYVRNVRPGDTVRAEESTLLDAPPDGTLRCSITGIS